MLILDGIHSVNEHVEEDAVVARRQLGVGTEGAEGSAMAEDVKASKHKELGLDLHLLQGPATTRGPDPSLGEGHVDEAVKLVQRETKERAEVAVPSTGKNSCPIANGAIDEELPVPVGLAVNAELIREEVGRSRPTFLRRGEVFLLVVLVVLIGVEIGPRRKIRKRPVVGVGGEERVVGRKNKAIVVVEGEQLCGNGGNEVVVINVALGRRSRAERRSGRRRRREWIVVVVEGGLAHDGQHACNCYAGMAPNMMCNCEQCWRRQCVIFKMTNQLGSSGHPKRK